MAEHSRELGGDPASRIALGGDSAGGNLATVVARHARDEGGPPIAFQLLICPMTDARMTTGSWRSYADNPIIPKAATEQSYAAYAAPDGGQGRLDDPDVSPANAADLSGLPPVFLATGACDQMGGVVDTARRSIDEAAAALRAGFARGPR